MQYLEIQFQGNRRQRYFNPNDLPFKLDEFAILETEKGEDIGRVVELGEMPAEEMKRIRYSVLRKANKSDHARRSKMAERELFASETAISNIRKHKLPMKLVRTEYQLDGRKVTFYFTADGRVDFRSLVKDLAAELRTRIDLRQIGARDESRKVAGFGICGRQLCCNTFLSHFDPITTQMAKQQNLPLNPAKLSGNCGRLRCCLQYEIEFYKERMKLFPHIGRNYRTERGNAVIADIDIFQETVRLRFSDGDEETLSLQEFREFTQQENSAIVENSERQPSENTTDEPEPSSAEDSADARINPSTIEKDEQPSGDAEVNAATGENDEQPSASNQSGDSKE